MTHTMLPEDWEKEEDQDQNITYHYKPFNITTKEHPNLSKIKVIVHQFYGLDENQNLSDKNQNLSDKNQNFDKFTLGNKITDKVDLDNYVISNIASKFPKYNLNDRIPKDIDVLNPPNIPMPIRNDHDIKQLFDQKSFTSEDKLQFIEKIFAEHCYNFYLTHYNIPIKNIENLIRDLVNQKDIFTPRMVVSAFQMFNIIPKDIDLFNYGALIYLFPLPDNVHQTNKDNANVYTFFGYKIKRNYPPAYDYLLDCISFMKKQEDRQ